jgi:hypothetical protein
MQVEEDGYALIAGTRCPVIGIHMCGGDISLRLLVPGGFPGEAEAAITLFGHDDKGITQISTLVDVPAVPDENGFGLIELSLSLVGK